MNEKPAVKQSGLAQSRLRGACLQMKTKIMLYSNKLTRQPVQLFSQCKKWCNRRESTAQRRAIILNKSGGKFEGQHTQDAALMRSINGGPRNRVHCHFMEKHFQRRLTRSNGAIYGHDVWIVPVCRKFPPFQHILHRQIHRECVGQHVKHYTLSIPVLQDFLSFLLPYSTT